MLKNLWQQIFWHQKFDGLVERYTWYQREWAHIIPNFSAPNRGAWRQRHDEKIAYWRSEGKPRGLSPLLAVFTALRETAEDLYEAHGGEEGTQPDFNQMAVHLDDVLKRASYHDSEHIERYFLRQNWKDRAMAMAQRRAEAKGVGRTI